MVDVEDGKIHGDEENNEYLTADHGKMDGDIDPQDHIDRNNASCSVYDKDNGYTPFADDDKMDGDVDHHDALSSVDDEENDDNPIADNSIFNGNVDRNDDAWGMTNNDLSREWPISERLKIEVWIEELWG